MKSKYLFLVFIFIFLQNIQSQSVMLKLGGLIFPTGEDLGYILDGGIEFRLSSHWSTQLSVSTTQVRSEGKSIDKVIVTPQLRYYFKSESFQKSPYFGIVLQRHKAVLGTELINEQSRPHGWQTETFTKYGVGLILGGHRKIYKRLGFDIHVGGLIEIGDINTEKGYWSVLGSTTPTNTSILENNKVTPRPFIGFNLYWAFSEPNTSTTKKITKNTEGVF